VPPRIGWPGGGDPGHLVGRSKIPAITVNKPNRDSDGYSRQNQRSRCHRRTARRYHACDRRGVYTRTHAAPTLRTSPCV